MNNEPDDVSCGSSFFFLLFKSNVFWPWIRDFGQSSIWSFGFWYLQLYPWLTPNFWFNTIFPLPNYNINLNFSVFFILVLSLGFMQFNSQLTIKLSIFFNFTPDFHQLGPHSSVPFADWSLAVNFFNLTPN